MDGIRSSVLTAFYTPPVFVRAIADTIYRTGDISAERMLDPSAGTGVFAEAFSGEGRAAETVCFEKDPLTGAILGKLFPGYEVHTDSFHRINSDYNGSFDLVASNIPFGTMQVFDAAFASCRWVRYSVRSKRFISLASRPDKRSAICPTLPSKV